MIEIRALRADDNRDGFSSGDVDLDRFFHKFAGQNQFRLPKYPLPALRLARLAVAESAQGQGIGKQLLKAVFGIAHEMAERTGCVAVVVDAKPEAVEFYQRYGFEAFKIISGGLGDRPSPLPMILPLASIPRNVS